MRPAPYFFLLPLLWLLPSVSGFAQSPIHLASGWGTSLPTEVYNVRTDNRLPAHPVGDGAADDLPALQADVKYLRNEHGILYLPSGTYRLDNSAGGGLTLFSGVILEGDGKSRTILKYGEGGNPNSWGIQFYNCDGAGLANLSLVNVCPPELPPYAHPVHNGITFWRGHSDHLFFSGVAWDLGYGDKLDLGNVHGLEISGCTVEAGRVNHGVVWLDGFQDLRLTGSAFHYHVGRILVRGGERGLIQGNTFERDGGIPTPRLAESGGIEASFSDSLAVEDNTITVRGEPDTVHNDGEAVLTQTALAHDFRDVGRLSATSGLTLTDEAKDWSQVATFVPRSVVCLVSGPALGQWRHIVGHTATTLTLDAPFLPAPSPGDQYTITSWSAFHLTIQGNKIVNNIKGIEIYDGGWDVRIQGNTMIDSDGIRLRGVDRVYRNDSHIADQIRHDPAWKCEVRGNRLSNPHGERLSHITVEAAQIGPGHGNTCWHNVIAGNVLVPHALVPGRTAQSQAWGVLRDGVGTLRDGPRGTVPDPLALLSTEIEPGQVMSGGR